MPGLYTGATGLWGGFAGLLYGSSALSTPPGLLADAGGFTPASLFAQGEQGVWYDPSDMTTLFQDAAGTTPVTAVEQPVGLMLDKSQGLVLGSQTELVSNPGPFTATTGWTVKDPASGSLSVASGQLTLTTAGTTSAYAAISTVVGAAYQVVGTIVSAVSGGGFYGIRKSDNVAVTTNVENIGTTNSTGEKRAVFIATATTTYISLQCNGAGSVTVSGISVKQWYLGNHASQSTSTARPVLSARVNLLTYTEQFDNAAWSKTAASVTQNATTSPVGTLTADLLVPDTANTTHFIAQNITGGLASGQTYTLCAKPSGYTWLLLFLYDGTFGNRLAYFNLSGSGSTGYSMGMSNLSISGPDAYGFYTVSAQPTSPAATISIARIYVSNANGSSGVIPSYAGDGTSGIYIWGADLRPANAGVNLPAYQRVVTATDYDTTGFPMYLRFDGTDDGMATGTINPGSVDKAQVFAGVRKLSDAATGMVAEWSTTVANPGTFGLKAPAAVNSYQFETGGSVAFGGIAGATGLAAPRTNVVTGLGDISGDSAILRVNGSAVASSTSDQGTGNYTSQPLYIGRRGGTSNPFNGNLYSLVVRFSATNLPDATIAQTETWVNGKTGAY